jgi:DNA-binding SARP family transcriptional activator
LPSIRPSSLRSRIDPMADASLCDGTVKLFLLGGFELRAGPRPVELPFRVQRLAAFLALANRRLHRAYVSGRLWLDATQEQAYGSLRAALWEARRFATPLVEATSTHVALSPFVLVDAHELSACADRLLDERASRWDDVRYLARAGNELLPDWYEDWVVEQRDQLRERRALALEAAAARLIREQRYTQASSAALAAITADPVRESAYELLICSYLATGNVAGARRQFAVLEARLRGIGLRPTCRLKDLMRQLA